MLDNIVIEKATMDNLKRVQELSQGLVEYEHRYLNNNIINLEWSMGKDGEKNFADLIQSHFVYIAKYQDTIVGYICGEIHDKKPWYNIQFAQLLNLYVLEEYRNKGIGTALIDKFKSYCLEKNVTDIELYTLYNNDNARKTYEKYGFKTHNVHYTYTIEETLFLNSIPNE